VIPIRVLATRLRFEMRARLGARPELLLPLLRVLRDRKHDADWLTAQPFDSKTEIVIEGFPRSANTFATVAFSTAQRRPNVRIAHHIHSPAQIIAAARRSVPSILLVREPSAAVISLIIRNPRISASQALRAYLRFYEPLVNLRDSVVVAEFGQVVSDFGSVVERVNERFGTTFERFEHTSENVDHCFRIIAERNARRSASVVESTRGIPVPAAGRAGEQRELREMLTRLAFRKLLDESQDVYRHVVGTA